jgi:lysophospholipase L1-like esterase
MTTKRIVALVFVFVMTVPAIAQERRREHWVATWATALVARAQPGAGRGVAPGPPAAAPAAPAPAAGAPPVGGPGAAAAAGGRGRGGFPPPTNVSNQTLRQIVHTSIGGTRLRVVLSNAFGTEPVEIGAAAIALRDKDAAIVTSSTKPLTFDGNPKATVLPGATLVSDAVDVKLAPLSDLVVDLFLPGELGVGPSPVTTHNGASQTNYLSPAGNHVGEPAFVDATKSGAWFLLARVEVAAAPSTMAVATFGDSITDGARSTSDMNNRWPDELARRLAAKKADGVAVLNAGISGNRVLGDGAGISALARFDRDVLMQTGVTHVIVMEGINDIGIGRSNPTPSAADLIAGHKQLIERAHARGLKIYGATLTPFEGAPYYTQEGEAKRTALNEWIRTSHAYDGVVDFDMVTRDPTAPRKFLPAYDSGDHLHPGDAGYKAMGDAIDLALFK